MSEPMTDEQLVEHLADLEAEIAGLTYAHQALLQAADEAWRKLRQKREQLAALRALLERNGRLS
jgi:chromosome segregation ATPase